ncbi:putative ubiquitin-conjugating enzyme E2 38 [Diospyros lotus]|uniref:putative ubiquitin-conjugating enzyme E2 38 n=1 Tax=Diospyros lotus TaxID=55363 RepID=UPI002250252C|nr:putative ubiquitin-conjugating enzyme E2 38 [Diospyros lotus]
MEIDQFDSVDSQVSAKKLKHHEGDVAKDSGKGTVIVGSTSGSVTSENLNDFEKSSVMLGTSGSINSDNLNGSNSDMSYHNDNDADEAVDNDDDNVSDYDDNDDFMYDDDDDEYLRMQSQFDHVDLPPGVEASVSWLKGPVPSANCAASTGPSIKNDIVTQPEGAGIPSLKIYLSANSEIADPGSSSSTVLAEPSSVKEQEVKDDEVIRKFQHFKQFDTVDDFSDHHFNRLGFSGQQPPKTWTKRIQEEWKILEKDLPDTIYVRVYETRVDLLRSVIIGPAGTPYHDGLFVFDVLFPPTYPDIPPMVYYYSGGLRLNPNLYDCGKVCLSLLNTWSGDKNEMWMPKTSTMLQVLVSIQALILNPKPFFNEPGYANMYTGPEGEWRSKAYNEEVFILSLKTMMYTLRRPPKHFEDLVAGHFRFRALDILSACKAYIEGAEVGSVVEGRAQDPPAQVDTGKTAEFKATVAKMMNSLVSYFSKNGSSGCEQFLPQR